MADDIHDADGKTVLDYWQAVAAGRERGRYQPERTGPYTVGMPSATMLSS